jgi:hypothetical protein
MPESTLRAYFLRRDLGAPVFSPNADAGSVYAGRLRIGLMAGCAISAVTAMYVGDPAIFTQADPALARLLRGMALIKGGIVLAALAAVSWRFGRPVSKAVAAAYLFGSWILVGSTMLIWQLSWIPAAAILFHAAGLSMLFVSWREQ